MDDHRRGSRTPSIAPNGPECCALPGARANQDHPSSRLVIDDASCGRRLI
jgi:hypothetical protein